MNIHPIFVHFPVALLSLYCLFELVRFQKIKSQPYWFYIKAVLLICGTLGSYTALITGDMAKDLVLAGQESDQYLRSIIRLHESWADTTIILFSTLSAGYIVVWLNKYDFLNFLPGSFLKQLWVILSKIAKFLIETKVAILLALFGLVAITITGALGGSIVYGKDVDPVVRMVYKLLVK